jgi:hypothetical protein
MNTLWQLETREFKWGANLLASIFEKIFAMSSMRPMGLKSVTLKASAFLGKSMMFSEFINSNPWAFTSK